MVIVAAEGVVVSTREGICTNEKVRMRTVFCAKKKERISLV